MDPDRFRENVGLGNFVLRINSKQLPPRAPKIEKVQSRLKISISIEDFNPELQNSPQKAWGAWWVARLKFSISLENFKILKMFNLWALRDCNVTGMQCLVLINPKKIWMR